jgi:hypothetical protein
MPDIRDKKKDCMLLQYNELSSHIFARGIILLPCECKICIIRSGLYVSVYNTE